MTPRDDTAIATVIRAPRGATPAERAALGRSLRAQVPRSSSRVPERPRDAVRILADQDRDRVPDLLPLRYGRMAASPFAFFRGSAAVMAADLATLPVTGLQVQLCGDAHLSNFGLFASPERQLVFDINDFDETLPGPWEWDVQRLTASLEIAGRDNGLRSAARRSVVLAAAGEYRRAVRELAGWSTLQVWYAHLPAERLLAELSSELDRRSATIAKRSVRRAKTRDHLRAASRLVRSTPDGLQLVSDPPLLVPLRDLLGPAEAAARGERVIAAMGEYAGSLSADRRVLLEQYRLVDIARKVVGVGSVGTRAYVVLLVGRDDSDPLLMQIKQASASVLESHLGPSRYQNAGQRVVAGQRTMQAVGDILLGWQRFADFNDAAPRDFYVRQLHDWKGTIDVGEMTATVLAGYGRLCAWTLARAHARSGDRIAIAAYLGGGDRFDLCLAEASVAVADRNERDHGALVDAIAAGRITAVSER